ncbi:MAG TPA: cellulose synthase subunit BcsC-related outer membrane protein [Noviherbaspirillum sp.]|nr:cellulose synthase subunit BcsC-related outer membrane protein [Noviherbaspirillum sp.]
MRRTVLAALLLTLGTRGWADGMKGGLGGQNDGQARPAPSRILELNEKRANVLHEETPPGTLLRLETQAGQAAVRERADGLKSSSPVPGNVVRHKESAPHRMRSTHDTRPQEPGMPDTPLVLKMAMAVTLPRADGPDERRLWRMLDGGQYDALLERLERLRSAYPSWRPPARLLALAQEGQLRQRIEQARESGNHEALIALAQDHPGAFDCTGIASAWSLAQAHAALGRQPDAGEVVHRLLECPDEADRLATLYKSREWLASDWGRLIALEERMPRSPEGEEKFSRLRYDYRMEQLAAAVDSGANDAALGMLSALMPDIDKYKDAGAALLAGWVRYRAEQPGGAAAAFANALQWDAGQHEARRGLALIALQEKRHEEALYQAGLMPEQVAGRGGLLRDVRLTQAQDAYVAGRHEEAVRFLQAARDNAPLPRYGELLDAWSRLQLGDAAEAASRFARLYGEDPDTESAQGALLALTRAGREDELKRLAQSGPESSPLIGLLARRDADAAFSRKRFLAAASLDAQSYAGLGSAAAAQASLIAAMRSKSGSAGMSRLDLKWWPSVETAIAAGPAGELRLRMDHVLLDSGTLPPNMPVGSFPAGVGGYAYAPVTRVRGWQPRLSWRDERDHVWEAEIGATPAGGAAGAAWTGRVALRDKAGAWHWATYREPVRESILSWTGMRDPYHGGVWGRVIRSGVLGGGQMQLDDRWSLSAQVAVEQLGGERVAGNRRIAADAGISRSLHVAGMDYVVLGISAATERYEHNLSHFTIGHGGYFSPQRYWRIGPSLDFMTEENRRFILRGRISAGRTGKHEAAAPLFPLAPDGRVYASSSGTGTAYDMELSAVWRMNAHVQLGAMVAKRNSPQYRDHAALGFVRIQFESGKSSLSSDLPAGWGRELF